MRRIVVVVVALLVVAILAVVLTASFWVNWFWFGSLGLRQVLWTRYVAQWALFGGAALVAALFFGLNVRYAARQLLGAPVTVQGQQVVLAPRLVTVAAALGGIVVGGLLGSAAAGDWPLVLNYLNRTNFGVTEPIYGRDAAFYVFTIPLLTALRSWLLGLLILTSVAVGALGFLRYSQGLARRQTSLPREVRGHLSILGALTLAVFSFSYWLANFNLLYSTRGYVFGAGRADIVAQRPANYILLVISAAAALLLGWNAFARRLRPLVAALGIWGVAAVVVGVLFPAGYQSFIVRPNELRQETPYIENNIRLTRQAYGLEGITQGQLQGDARLTAQDIAAYGNTVNNVRLWDYRPLQTTYNAIQRIQQYYEFADVDIDRYRFPAQSGAAATQVTLSARELDVDQLPPRAQNWQNRHLVYTHGYGVVVSPVNRFTPQGRPELLLRDLPVTGDENFRLQRPEIYFGERTDDYVIVNTRLREFDRPGSDTQAAAGAQPGQEVYTRYAGTGGVPVDSIFKKLVFAAAFGDSRILLSADLPSSSRALYHRNIQERVSRVAPFLRLDRDPYLVILDGRLIWVQDAYTVTGRFPYSEPLPGRDFNYIRNSVKITVDAYTGDVTFYAVDERDALLQTYRKTYPDLFKPVSAAPAALVEHFRYPEDLFTVQAETYSTYHLTTAQAFYNRDNQWRTARETFGGRLQTMEPYYVNIRLPGQDREEFVLILPFTPAGEGRNNMVAWMAARMDGPNYGQLQVYTFPQGKFIDGPQQIDARINQEPSISSELTLLDQRGSQVIRGNLLVIPVGDALLYVQPLYLQATNSPIPELRRIIVTSAAQGVVMSDTLEAALTALAQNRSGIVLAQPGAQPPPTTGTPSTPPAGGAPAATPQQALEAYNRAQEALRRGDWAAYGREQAELERLLRELAGR